MAKAKKAEAPAPTTETAKEFATRHVVEFNGEHVRNNKNFDALVKDAQEQIEANRKATEGM